jgi:hypothetical protein
MLQTRRIRDDDDLPEPPHVRRLRLLVTVLMVVLIGGMVVVVVAMVVRLGGLGGPDEAPVPGPVSAEAFSLPAGADVVSLGRGPGEVLIVTRDPAGAETLRVFDAASGAEKSATPIARK